MADDKDVLGKADALLRRHTIAPPRDGSETGGVPVLTDFVDAPEGSPGTAPARDALTQEVINRVMAEVERRLGADLERRLLEHLTPQVHAAVASALGDLHQELANAIGDAIAQALERRRVK
ncbi:MAG TPA: hypothetical protein VFP36_09560 [Usitatibacter sp.]|nr:hypothetical protein [Usitatibacter sp.]